MATITINDETYRRLLQKAAATNQTVDDLLEPVITEAAAATPESKSADGRLQALRGWMEAVQQRAHRYPPGYEADDSRESIYEGCGE